MRVAVDESQDADNLASIPSLNKIIPVIMVGVQRRTTNAKHRRQQQPSGALWGKVTIVFFRERSGLENDETDAMLVYSGACIVERNAYRFDLNNKNN